jgi:outer membrane murein-binding lipoprotein Lpp
MLQATALNSKAPPVKPDDRPTAPEKEAARVQAEQAVQELVKKPQQQGNCDA